MILAFPDFELGGHGAPLRYVRTLRGPGYGFVAPVDEHDREAQGRRGGDVRVAA